MSRTAHRHSIQLATFSMQPALKPDRGPGPLEAGERNLGAREREVLSVLWKNGSSTVQQVGSHLSVSLAYTTVMTTLDRLFKKGFALREKHDRAFLYSAAITEEDMERQRASDLVHHFFEKSPTRQNLLLSHLVDAVHRYDTELLGQLEDEIRFARLRRLRNSLQQETS